MTIQKPQQSGIRLAAGSRHYFFDLKPSEQGPYLLITESRPSNGTFERQRILVEVEYLEKFVNSLRALAQPELAKSYKPWASEEDELLRKELAEGKGIAEIAREHKRATGAIRSRIKHLENRALTMNA